MSSFSTYIKEDVLPEVVPPIVAIGLIVGLIAFNNIGGFAFIQSLPLFRMDRSDACWFAICCAVYFIPFCIVGAAALGCIAAVVGLVIGACVLFYKHIILKPGRIIVIIFTGLVLLWVGGLGYDVALELIEYLS